MKKVIISFLFLLLTSCDKPDTTLDQSLKLNENEFMPIQANTDCSVYESRKWHAWLDRNTEKEGMYRLIVTGEVDLPSPAHTINWSVGITDRMQPPGQRLSISTTASKMAAIQVITPTETKFMLETPSRAFGSVSVYCGDRLLVRIPDVMLTD